MAYSNKVIDHYENPRNVGSFAKGEEGVATGMVGAPACGDVMKLQIKVGADGRIEDAKFKTFGCGSAIASSSLATEWVNGGTAVTEFSLASGSLREVWKGEERLHGHGNFPTFALTPDGASSVAVRNDFTTPPEVWSGPPGSWRKLTAGNTSQTPHWGKGESLEWQSDGLRIQGWMLPPAQVEPGKRYPMVVLVHGGPAGMEAPRWPNGSSIPAALASKGYYVLMPNPRGSYGGGAAFTQGNVKDFGGGDLDGFLGGIPGHLGAALAGEGVVEVLLGDQTRL